LSALSAKREKIFARDLSMEMVPLRELLFDVFRPPFRPLRGLGLVQ
jgi:hypothetical protein